MRYWSTTWPAAKWRFARAKTLQSSAEKNGEQIADAGRRLVQVPTITYLRDVGPYYASMHMQLFRQDSTTATSKEFCAQDCYRTVLDSLKYMHDVLGREAMAVIHYESTIDSLDVPFMCTEERCDEFDRSMLAKRANRSLKSKYEWKCFATL